MTTHASTTPTRRVIQAEAIAWLDANAPEPGASVITSLPDVSEMPEPDLDAWRRWFMLGVRRVLSWVPSSVAIFYQSDVRHRGVLIDKGYLVMRAIEEAGAHLAFHKIVCRRPPGTIALGRPSYSHMIAASMTERPPPRRPGPDVLPDAGFMPWSRAMGVTACRVACRFLEEETDTRLVVDPFCGRGTVLAIANAMGLDALGVDISARRCRAARALVLGSEAHRAATTEEALQIGARLFDAGAFWEAHEAWEARWQVERDVSARRALQGLIQIAAGFHKLVVMDEPDSAQRLWTKGLAKLDAAPADWLPPRFRADVAECHRALEAGASPASVIAPRLSPSPIL